MDQAGYQVRVEGKWYPVPRDTILQGDTCGADPDDSAQSEAKVWYTWTRDGDSNIASISILCFEPGIAY
jgi:hypothetical protein